MRNAWFVALAAACLFGCSGQKGENAAETAGAAVAGESELPRQASPVTDEEAQLGRLDPAGIYGEGLTLGEGTAVGTVLADPAAFEGKKVQVTAKVDAVCPMRGCWIDIADPETGASMRVKVQDGAIVFPKSAAGHMATVEGVVEKLELTEEDAVNMKKHEAEEKGETFDPASVTGPEVVWRILGTGAKIEG